MPSTEAIFFGASVASETEAAASRLRTKEYLNVVIAEGWRGERRMQARSARHAGQQRILLCRYLILTECTELSEFLSRKFC
jgi:hypothetical protein